VAVELLDEQRAAARRWASIIVICPAYTICIMSTGLMVVTVLVGFILLVSSVLVSVFDFSD
jgi:hypothetical protein